MAKSKNQKKRERAAKLAAGLAKEATAAGEAVAGPSAGPASSSSPPLPPLPDSPLSDEAVDAVAPAALEPPPEQLFTFVPPGAFQQQQDTMAADSEAAALAKERRERLAERADTYDVLVDRDAEIARLQEVVQQRTDAENRLRGEVVALRGSSLANQTVANEAKLEVQKLQRELDKSASLKSRAQSLSLEHRDIALERQTQLAQAKEENKRLNDRLTQIEGSIRTLTTELASVRQRADEADLRAARHEDAQAELQQVGEELEGMFKGLGEGLQIKDYLAHVREREAEYAQRAQSPDRRSSPSRERGRQVSGTSMHDELAQQGYDSDAEHAEEERWEENEKLMQRIQVLETAAKEREATWEQQSHEAQQAANQQLEAAKQQAQATELEMQKAQAKLNEQVETANQQAKAANSRTREAELKLDKANIVLDGLAILNQALEIAKQQAQTAEQTLQEVQTQLENANIKVGELPALKKQVETANKQIKSAHQQKQADDRKIQEVQTLLQKSTKKVEELAPLTKQIETAKNQVKIAQQQTQNAHRKTQEVQSQLDKANADLKTVYELTANATGDTGNQALVAFKAKAEADREELSKVQAANHALETEKEVAELKAELMTQKVKELEASQNVDIASLEKGFAPHEGEPYLQQHTAALTSQRNEDHLRRLREASYATLLDFETPKPALALSPTTSISIPPTAPVAPVTAHAPARMIRWLTPSRLLMLLLAVIGFLLSLAFKEWNASLAANDVTRQHILFSTLDYTRPRSPPSLVVEVGTRLGVDYRTLM